MHKGCDEVIATHILLDHADAAVVQYSLKAGDGRCVPEAVDQGTPNSLVQVGRTLGKNVWVRIGINHVWFVDGRSTQQQVKT